MNILLRNLKNLSYGKALIISSRRERKREGERAKDRTLRRRTINGISLLMVVAFCIIIVRQMSSVLNVFFLFLFYSCHAMSTCNDMRFLILFIVWEKISSFTKFLLGHRLKILLFIFFRFYYFIYDPTHKTL